MLEGGSAMRVLALNCGSSSLKFGLFEAEPAHDKLRRVLAGSVQRIGDHATLTLRTHERTVSEDGHTVADHRAAIQWMADALGRQRVELRVVDAVGHRVVHGGTRFRRSVRLDAELLAGIEQLSELAPLHNPACVAGILGAQQVLGPAVPMVAVFDTALFHDLPPVASTYAISRDLAARHGIRRYGFHGIAHASLAAGYTAAAGRSLDGVRLITFHLGNGCSAAALRNGRAVDTSMGFTPLEGLVMGTRSGDLDPALVSYLARREGVPADTVERWLNERSGLFGLSGLSRDMRELLAAERQDAHAALAIELFCYRARKYLGAYLAALGGADAVVFGGGIGEQAPEIRARICEGMDWCGLKLDPARNAGAVGLPPGGAALISPDEARPAAYVVAADEETQIAYETVRCLFRTSED